MRLRTRLTAASLVVSLLVLAAGCGGPGATTTITTTLPPTTTTLPPTTTSSTTTTTLPPTTTTTVPRLDRTDAAVLARMRADLGVLLGNGPRVSGSDAETAAAAYFAAAAAVITGSASRQEEVPLPTGGTSHNAWSAEVGTGEKLLLLGGHIDTVAGAPGANDNGSGVVILLEVLRRLVEDPPEGLRVVVVAFGAEERIGDLGHHFGSRHAVTELVAAGVLPDMMISVDMVGVGDQLHVIDFDGIAPAFADELAGAARDAGFLVDRRTRGEISDHVAFTRAGVPAAHLWRSEDPEYHTPGDDDFEDAAVLEALALVEALIDFLIPEAHDLEGGDNHHV